MDGRARSDLALFGGDELLKHRFVKLCVMNSESSDSSHMEVGWEGDSGDDSLLYQATDMVETNEDKTDSDMFSDIDKKVIPDTPSDGEMREETDEDNADSDMFSDSDKKVIPDTPSDCEIREETEDDVEKETEVLKGLLDEVGLKYNNVVVKSCRSTKGMVVCDMTCKLDIKTILNIKLARQTREAAVLAALKDITGRVRNKFFPELVSGMRDQELCDNKQSLLSLCQTNNRPEPQFTNWLEEGFYCARVRVGEQEATSAGFFQVLAEAEGSASKLWINMFGGVVKVKSVAHSEVFSYDNDENVDEAVSKENWPNLESFASKEETGELVTVVQSNRRPKKGGFFSSLDNMTKEELSVGQDDIPAPTIKTAFAMLDKKTSSKPATQWSPRKEVATVPRRSPRKQMKIQNMLQSQKKSELLKELFDDSSLSVTSQDDLEDEIDKSESETPVKRARSVSSEKVSAKKHKQEQEGIAGEKVRTGSVSLELSATSNTAVKLDKRKYSPNKLKAKSPRNKKVEEQEIVPTPPTPPALKVSPKKKFGMFGKLSKKVVEDVEVKPKFQFNLPKEEQKTIKDHLNLGKDKKSIESTKVDKDDEKKSVKKSKVFEETKNASEEEFEVPVSKKSGKENGSQRKKKSVKISNIFEEELESKSKNEVHITTPKKSGNKVKKGKEDGKKSIESPAKKPVFKFSEEDKSKNPSSKNKATKDDKVTVVPIPKAKESISSVFEVEDDPYVLMIIAREKKEAEKLAVRTKVQTKGRKRQSMAKMAEFSQSLTGSQSMDEYSQESSSDESGAKFKIPKLKKPRKKKEVDSSQKKINTFFKKGAKMSKELIRDEFEEVRDYTPSIDELLKLPDRPEDGGKTMDEVLDDLDVEIAERKRIHEEEMAKIDTDIAAEKRRQEERRGRMKENALLRDRLEAEITELVLRRMFRENTDYLESIKAGKVESTRHEAFHKSSRTRHALYYAMITDPFTDDQLEWTLEEIGKVWMKNKREQMDNNEYVWKVLLAECFIKFYMDHFGYDKKEAEKRISETPLHKKGEDSDEENSSDDEV